MKLPEIAKSKKFQAFLLGLLAVICKHLIGLSDEDVTKIVGLVGTYVIGQGISDNGKAAAELNRLP